jgi:hypothetical protein
MAGRQVIGIPTSIPRHAIAILGKDGLKNGTSGRARDDFALAGRHKSADEAAGEGVARPSTLSPTWDMLASKPKGILNRFKASGAVWANYRFAPLLKRFYRGMCSSPALSGFRPSSVFECSPDWLTSRIHTSVESTQGLRESKSIPKNGVPANRNNGQFESMTGKIMINHIME